LLRMVVLLPVKIIRCLKSSMLPRVMRPLKDPDSQGGETECTKDHLCYSMFLRSSPWAEPLVITGRVLCQQPEIHAGRE
jgi:hypothetical protein